MTDPALLTAATLSEHYRRGTLTPIEALQATLERVARLNPRLNAFAVLNPRALEAAGDSTQRWRSGNPLSPIDGVPCTIKDLIDLAGFPTRRGSRTTSSNPVPDDAPIAAALKRAGAVIIGKTTTTEFGWKSPGDCPLHGITRNPWNLAHTPGGSSSGAAAAAAASFGPLHVGTDAGGSVRIPAAWSGLVGLKPTFGRIPQWPLGAFGAVACAGPMTRTLGDCALLLAVLARHDPRDPYSLPDAPQDYRATLDHGVAGLTIGILRRPGFDAPADPEAIVAVERAASLLADAGANIEDATPDLPDTRLIFGRVWSIALATLVAGIPPDQRSLLDEGLRRVAANVRDIPATDLLAAEAMRLQAAHAMARLHRRFDLLLCPAVPGPPPLAGAQAEDPKTALWQDWAPWTFTFNLTRQPAIAVPMGLTARGLPRSVQLAAALYRDDLTLRAARILELADPLPPAPFTDPAS